MSEYPNWFAKSAIDNFATYLIQDTGLPDLKYLQLGAFTGGVLNVDPGMYEGEIVINFNGQVQTVYDTLRFTVRENF